jgi:hypothetical protein
MGVYVQTSQMAILSECFCLEFCFGTAWGAKVCGGHWHRYFQQPWRAAWAMELVHLSHMFMCMSRLVLLLDVYGPTY